MQKQPVLLFVLSHCYRRNGAWLQQASDREPVRTSPWNCSWQTEQGITPHVQIKAWRKISVVPGIDPTGLLRTQHLRTFLLKISVLWKVFSSLPRVGQNIAMYTLPTARTFSLSNFCTFLVHSAFFFFFSTSSLHLHSFPSGSVDWKMFRHAYCWLFWHGCVCCWLSCVHKWARLYFDLVIYFFCPDITLCSWLGVN